MMPSFKCGLEKSGVNTEQQQPISSKTWSTHLEQQPQQQQQQPQQQQLQQQLQQQQLQQQPWQLRQPRLQHQSVKLKRD